MNVIHNISGMNITSGGPSLSTYNLVKGLRSVGVNAEIAAYASRIKGNQPIATDDFIHFLPAPFFSRLGYSESFKRFYRGRDDLQLFHAHGLWQYAAHAASDWARGHGKPYVISPRGMLYPEALKKSAVFKKVALALYQKRDLQEASCIHATCDQEYRYIRECGIDKTPVAIIPNAIIPMGIEQKSPRQYGAKRIGFVGRFAPIKNLESLIWAWAGSSCPSLGWELVLVGDGSSDYRGSLETLAFSELGLKSISFPGFLSGQQKHDMLLSLDCLVLPSKSENFGMVVPEALCRGIPVIASKGTPWRELRGRSSLINTKLVPQEPCAKDDQSSTTDYSISTTGRCGWWIDNDVDSLVAALNDLVGKEPDELRVMGLNGIELVDRKYSVAAVAEEMKRVYSWLVEEERVPACVRPT